MLLCPAACFPESWVTPREPCPWWDTVPENLSYTSLNVKHWRAVIETAVPPTPHLCCQEIASHASRECRRRGLAASGKVLYEGDVAAGVHLVSEQQLILIAIDADSGVRWGMPVQSRDGGDFTCRGLIELDVPYRLAGIEEIDAGNCDGPVAPEAACGLGQNVRLRTAARRHLPKTGVVILREIEPLSVRRFHGEISAGHSDLLWLTAANRNLPRLPDAATVRCEINELPVGRPARQNIVRVAGGQLSRRAAGTRNNKDVRMSLGPGVESHQ